MTLGIDVSRLFPEMVMAGSTPDLVVKKMVYLYLCSYAVEKSELAVLSVNTLTTDCRDTDPMVRGLALRSYAALYHFHIVPNGWGDVRGLTGDPEASCTEAQRVGLRVGAVVDDDAVDPLGVMVIAMVLAMAVVKFSLTLH